MFIHPNRECKTVELIFQTLYKLFLQLYFATSEVYLNELLDSYPKQIYNNQNAAEQVKYIMFKISAERNLLNLYKIPNLGATFLQM